jgi:hypothetical protein
MNAKRAKHETKNKNTAACFCFLNYLAFLRPAADQAASVLPSIVSRGHSYRIIWAGSIIQKNVRMNDPTPAYSPVSDRRRPTALVEVHWARRVQAPLPQISIPNSQESTLSIHVNERGRRFHTGNRCAEKMRNGAF